MNSVAGGCDIPCLVSNWKIRNKSSEIFHCVEKVLRSMTELARYAVRDERLQVVEIPESMIWAHFPIYRRRWIVRQLPYSIDPRVKVLLVIGEDTVRTQPRRTTMAELAHHFGHALCYLRYPGWLHDCPDADRAARRGGLSRFLRTPQEIYGRRTRDFYCDPSESTIRRTVPRLKELSRA